jgi:hypothetical protein
MRLFKQGICILLLTCAAFAQEFRSSIFGRITDATGAVVPGAAVAAVNVDTNASAGTKTNEQGNYRIPFLLPGNYAVFVEQAGFRKIERRGIRVSVGSDMTLDFMLEVAATGESITVTAVAPTLNTANADLSQVVEQTYVRNLPVSLTRNVLNKALMTPGITRADTAGTVTSNGQTNIVISGGGGNTARNEIMVDGIPNTVARSGGVAVFVPSQDSVEEMKVQTTLFDAAYGHSNAGAISITTLAGTNEIHGSAYDFKRWRALNANSWENNRLSLKKPPLSYNQFGGVLSGPVYLPRIYDGRNRTFFTFSLENNSDKAPRTRQARVPTQLERGGDFSQTLNRRGAAGLEVYDPWSTTGSGTSAKRTLFPGARIPASSLNPTGVAVAKVYPPPNLAGPAQIGADNWAGNGVYQVLEDQQSIRIDQVVSSRQRMFGRFSRLKRQDEFVPVFFPGVLSFPTEGQSDLGLSYRNFYSVALDDTISFTPTLVGSVRYGLSYRYLPKWLGLAADGRTLADPSALNLAPVILQNQATKAFPILNMGERIIQMGGREDVENWYTHTVLTTFYKMVRNHSLKFGTDYRLNRWNKIYLGDGQSGSFAFSPVFTQANPSVPTTADTSGSGLASLLLGVPASGSLGYDSPLARQHHYLSLFVQEDWRVRPNLTLNFGVRYELETPYTERYNHAAFGFDYTAPSPLKAPGLDLRGGLLFAGTGGNPRREGNLDANNFGPRFGFAYSLGGRTVLRGGYGLFYGAQSYNSGFDGAIATFSAATPYVGTVDSGATPFATLANPFPGGLRLPQGSEAGLAARYGDSLSFFNQTRVNPYNQQWQFSVQRQLPGAAVLEAAYVGMLSLKILEAFNLNEKPDAYLSLGAEEDKKVTNPFLGVFSGTSQLGQGATVSQGQLWKRYPQYVSLTMEGANTGRAIFHGLQAKVEKRLSHGLNLLWAHTFSKLIVNNTTSIVNERHYRSVDDQDVRHVMRLAFVYQLPFGPGKPLGGGMRGVAARLAGGWNLSGFLSANTGFPLTITHANGRPIRLRNAAKSGAIGERLGYEIDPATRRVLNPYFDINAFAALPSKYVVSPEPSYFDELRGPGNVSLNLAVLKEITLKERLKLEVRAEAANATNSPNWANPGTNMSNLATFGVIPSGGNARSIQIGARLAF